MHIYIDESGQFRPLDGGRSRAAAVAAVVIPSGTRKVFGKAFRKVKRELNLGRAELKGSSLSESSLRRLLSVLKAHNALVEAVVIDVGAHETGTVTAFKCAQAERLLEHITRDHHPNLIQELIDFEHRVKRLPNQLFLQAFCLWQLIPRVLETATMFHSQRSPRELGRFVWRVDAKDKNITELETIWTTLIGPIVTTRSEVAPMGMIPGGDYSYYARFDAPSPESHKDSSDRTFTDLKRVFREDFQFVRSQTDLGVQAADIVASTLTRALNGALARSGWELLGPLLVKRKTDTVRVIELDLDAPGPSQRIVMKPEWASVVMALGARARPLLTTKTMALLRDERA